MKIIAFILLTFIAMSCSWEAHVSRCENRPFKYASQNNYTKVKRDTLVDGLPFQIHEIRTPSGRIHYKGLFVHYSIGRNSNYFAVTDTFYYRNGKVRQYSDISICRGCTDRLYEKEVYTSFDKSGQKLWIMVYDNSNELANPYKRYFNAEGTLLEEQHLVLYDMMEASKRR